MTCGGNFSQTTFDSLERKKQELKERSLAGRKMMRVFAKQLLAQQAEQEKIERKLEEISRRQDQMLDRESQALGEMDALVSGADPEVQIMGFEDDFFLYDDPNHLSSGMVMPDGESLLPPLVFDDPGGTVEPGAS
jgi:hypothetical protein